MLRTITAWNGEIDEIGVEDTEGGKWWPDTTTQDAIQKSNDPQKEAITICESDPMRGQWSN